MIKHLTLLLFIGLAWGQENPDTLVLEEQSLKIEILDKPVNNAKKDIPKSDDLKSKTEQKPLVISIEKPENKNKIN